MKLRNKIAIISLIAVIAIIGVGFATWTFTTSADSSISGISGSATAAIEASNVQVKTADGSAAVTTLYIICDSPNGDGIYWSTAADGSAPITQVKLIGSVNEDDNDILDFSTYVGTFTASMTGAPNSTTWINLPTVTLNQDVTSTSKNANVECLYTLPTLSYKAVPTNVSEVNALETEVNALSLTITFNFNVKSVA